MFFEMFRPNFSDMCLQIALKNRSEHLKKGGFRKRMKLLRRSLRSNTKKKKVVGCKTLPLEKNRGGQIPKQNRLNGNSLIPLLYF